MFGESVKVPVLVVFALPKRTPFVPDSPDNVARQTRRAARHAASRRWVSQLARGGYFAIGVVYLTMGVLAALGLAGISAGQYTGARGATRTLVTQPFGQFALGLITAGLLLYVAWRYAQAFGDVEDRGRSTTGWIKRGGLAVSGTAYGFVAVYALSRLVSSIGSTGGSKSDLVGKLMGVPGGRILVGLLGVAVAGAALFQLYAAARASFIDAMDENRMGPGARRWVLTVGRVGFASRTVVFGVVAWSMIYAAVAQGGSQPAGLGGALQMLGRQTYGNFLIGFVAGGLIAYGVFMLLKTHYRQLAPSEK